MKTQRFPNTDAHTRALAQRIKARLAYWDWLPEIPSSLLNGCWHSDVSGAPWRRDEWPRLGVRLVAAGVGGADRGGKWGRIRDVGWGGGDGCRGWKVEGGVEKAGGGAERARRAVEKKERKRKTKYAGASRPAATPFLQSVTSRWHVQFKESIPRCNGVWQSFSDSQCCWFNPFKIRTPWWISCWESRGLCAQVITSFFRVKCCSFCVGVLGLSWRSA